MTNLRFAFQLNSRFDAHWLKGAIMINEERFMGAKCDEHKKDGMTTT